MRVIVLSKNRPAQAELLLRSIKEQVADYRTLFITVFYNFDNEKYNQGYSLLQKIHPWVSYYKEDPVISLKEQFYKLILMKKSDFLSFLVDDLVVIRPFSTNDKQFKILKNNSKITALSLRLNPRISYCQPRDTEQYPCRTDLNGIFTYKKRRFGLFLEKNISTMWRIRKKLKVFMPIIADWEYPMVIDGNVFRFDEFKEYFPTISDFSKATGVELAMITKPLPGRKMIMYPASRLINVASNVVSGSSLPSLAEDAAVINDQFIDGGRLSYEHLKDMNNTSCHISTKLVWQPK